MSFLGQASVIANPKGIHALALPENLDFSGICSYSAKPGYLPLNGL